MMLLEWLDILIIFSLGVYLGSLIGLRIIFLSSVFDFVSDYKWFDEFLNGYHNELVFVKLPLF